MINYILKALKDFKNFDGRSRRSEFWYFMLAHLILSIIVNIIGSILGTTVLSMVYTLIILLPLIAVWIRRMHDVGKIGWFCLIPFYNIYLAVQDSEAGENEYGKNPKE